MKKIYDGPRSRSLFVPPGLYVGGFQLRTVSLESIVDKIYGSSVALPIRDTPHFKHLMGDKQPLRDYFESCRGVTWARKGTEHENMTVDYLISTFDDIANSEKHYLEPPYESY